MNQHPLSGSSSNPPGFNPPPLPYGAQIPMPQPHVYPPYPAINPPYPSTDVRPPYPTLDFSTTFPQPDYVQPQHVYPHYIPGTIMIPSPVAPSLPESNTYITNHIYHEESQPKTNTEKVQVVESSGDFNWVPTTSTTASSLTGRAVVGGHEGWDGSPLWVIRAWHNGHLLPGKLSVRHNSAAVVDSGKVLPVQNIEVLCANPDNLRWVPASNGNVPPGAISGGKTSSGETLYIGRARYQLSVTPGKVQRTLNACYIAFAGTEVAINMYDVLCRVS